MKRGVGNHCGSFLCASANCDWIKMLGYLFLGIICFTTCARAQQYGPTPSRPQQFAGAALIHPMRPNFRQRPGNPRVTSETISAVDQAEATQIRRTQSIRKTKTQPLQPQVIDQQRTNLIDDVASPYYNKIAAPTTLPHFQVQTSKLTPRPVEEEVNEDAEIPTTIVTTPSTTTYTVPNRSSYPPVPAPAPAPAPVQLNQIPSGFQRSQFVQPSALHTGFPQHVSAVQVAGPTLQLRQLIRQQQRPVQGIQATANRQLLPQALPPQTPISPQPLPEDDVFFRQVQSRPLKKQEAVKQQVTEREPIRQSPVRQPEVIRQLTSRAHIDYSRPIERELHAKVPQRQKKPVAQTIRKYHEEHEDGSITWGYENDDGSFKEETIGVDCVTRGKYGYYDPDGVKREYTYQTGIPCDKAQESEEAASSQGFIDYTNNKYVLPNGDEIDLEAMVKNRARKPVSRHANRA